MLGCEPSLDRWHGHFELFHRLNVVPITVPGLEKRREDIPALLNHYLAEAAREMKTSPKTLNADAVTALQQFDWPGNVRQVVNTARRLSVTAPGSVVKLEDLPSEIGRSTQANSSKWTLSLAEWADSRLNANDTDLLADALPQFERTLIRAALAHSDGHRQEAARLLGWGRNTLTRKMKILGLNGAESH